MCRSKKNKASPQCINCEAQKNYFEQKIYEKNEKIENLEWEVAKMRNQIAKNMEITLNAGKHSNTAEFSSQEVKQENILPENLLLGDMEEYYYYLQRTYFFLVEIISWLFSLTHLRKGKSKNTSKQWLAWSFFYKVYLCEMLLRTKQSKVVMRTSVLLGLLFLYTKVSSTTWNVLQKLRVVCSREHIEKWVKEQPDQIFPKNTMHLFSFDNCDFFRHVTSVRHDHHSIMINTCTQFIADLGEQVDIFACDLWKNVEKHDFIEYVCGDFDFANEIAKEAWTGVKSCYKSTWLKFAGPPALGHLKKTNFLILTPHVPCNTSTYEGVTYVLDNYWEKYVKKSDRLFSFVSTDQACHALVWGLKKMYPNKYDWVIPVPGEWHWTWHIMQGIFRMWGVSHFRPWSHAMGFANLDVHCKNFHYGEDFLQMVTMSLSQFVENLMEKNHHTNILQLLHSFHHNSQVYELIYLLVYYLCPYWITRSVIKRGNSQKIEEILASLVSLHTKMEVHAAISMLLVYHEESQPGSSRNIQKKSSFHFFC